MAPGITEGVRDCLGRPWPSLSRSRLRARPCVGLDVLHNDDGPPDDLGEPFGIRSNLISDEARIAIFSDAERVVRDGSMSCPVPVAPACRAL